MFIFAARKLYTDGYEKSLHPIKDGGKKQFQYLTLKTTMLLI
jgi:hypothetical protein